MQTAMAEANPEKEFITLPHPRESRAQKRLQSQYNILKNLSKRFGWTMPQRNVFLMIQNQLKEECIKTSTKTGAECYKRLRKKTMIQRNSG